MKKKLSICIPSSCGGHLKEVMMYKEAFSSHNIFYILNDKINNQDFLNKNKVYFISHIENYILVLINFIQAYFILKKTKPDLVISTGASPAFVISIISLFSSCNCLTAVTNRFCKHSSSPHNCFAMSDNHLYFMSINHC